MTDRSAALAMKEAAAKACADTYKAVMEDACEEKYKFDDAHGVVGYCIEAIRALPLPDEPAGAESWPMHCTSRSSCTRHKQCMYFGCPHQGEDISTAIDAIRVPTDDLWKENAQAATSVIRMIRAMIGEMFGAVANIESEEATLLRGPEPKHDGEAILAALQNIKSKLHDEPAAWTDAMIAHETKAYSVEAIDEDGSIECTVFSGPEAYERAESHLVRYEEEGDQSKTISLQPYRSSALPPAPEVDVMGLLNTFYEAAFRLGYDEAAEVDDDIMEHRQADSDAARAALVAALQRGAM